MITQETMSEICIGLQTKGESLFILRETPHLKTLRATPHVSSPPALYSNMAINTARIRCPGCNKAFTPRGLSQHSSKSPDSRCRQDHIALGPPAPYVSQTAFSPETDHMPPSWSSAGADSFANDLDVQWPNGMFAVLRDFIKTSPFSR